MLRRFFMLCAVVVLAACSQGTTINAKDQATYEHSVQLLMQPMDPQQRNAFENALKAVLFADVETLGDLMKQDEDEMRAKFYKRIDGKTPDQVIALAVELRGQKTPPQADQTAP